MCHKTKREGMDICSRYKLQSIGRRRKRVLLTAQVGEAELEDIVKIGHAGENVKALVGHWGWQTAE